MLVRVASVSHDKAAGFFQLRDRGHGIGGKALRRDGLHHGGSRGQPLGDGLCVALGDRGEVLPQRAFVAVLRDHIGDAGGCRQGGDNNGDTGRRNACTEREKHAQWVGGGCEKMASDNFVVGQHAPANGRLDGNCRAGTAMCRHFTALAHGDGPRRGEYAAIARRGSFSAPPLPQSPTAKNAKNRRMMGDSAPVRCATSTRLVASWPASGRYATPGMPVRA